MRPTENSDLVSQILSNLSLQEASLLSCVNHTWNTASRKAKLYSRGDQIWFTPESTRFVDWHNPPHHNDTNVANIPTHRFNSIAHSFVSLCIQEWSLSSCVGISSLPSVHQILFEMHDTELPDQNGTNALRNILDVSQVERISFVNVERLSNAPYVLEGFPNVRTVEIINGFDQDLTPFSNIRCLQILSGPVPNHADLCEIQLNQCFFGANEDDMFGVALDDASKLENVTELVLDITVSSEEYETLATSILESKLNTLEPNLFVGITMVIESPEIFGDWIQFRCIPKLPQWFQLVEENEYCKYYENTNF